MVTARAFTQYRIPLIYYQSEHLFSDHAIITLLLAQPQCSTEDSDAPAFQKTFFFSWQSSHCCRFGWSRRLVIPISCHLILPPYVTPNSLECQYFIAGGRAVGIYSFLVGRSQFPYCFQCKDKPFSTLKGMKTNTQHVIVSAVKHVKYDRYSVIRTVLSTVLELSTLSMDGVRLNMPSVRRPAVAQDVFIVKSSISTLFKFFCPVKAMRSL